jgi:hypothetical protein
MIYGLDDKEYCWKKPEEPLRDHHVKPTVKFGWVILWFEDALLLVGLVTSVEFMDI